MRAQLIIELIGCEISFCASDGKELTKRHKIARDLLDCARTGDCEQSCKFVLSQYKIDWRMIVKSEAGEYENVTASKEVKETVARAIYFASDADFSNENTAELYLLWQVASEFKEQLAEVKR